MPMSLICHLKVYLNDHIAIDYHANDPKGGSLAIRIARSHLKTISNEYDHEEGPAWGLDHKAPENRLVKMFVFLAYALIVDWRMLN